MILKTVTHFFSYQQISIQTNRKRNFHYPTTSISSSVSTWHVFLLYIGIVWSKRVNWNLTQNARMGLQHLQTFLAWLSFTAKNVVVLVVLLNCFGKKTLFAQRKYCIPGTALIRGQRSFKYLTTQVRRLFLGGAFSLAALIQIITVY